MDRRQGLPGPEPQACPVPGTDSLSLQWPECPCECRPWELQNCSKHCEDRHTSACPQLSAKRADRSLKQAGLGPPNHYHLSVWGIQGGEGKTPSRPLPAPSCRSSFPGHSAPTVWPALVWVWGFSSDAGPALPGRFRPQGWAGGQEAGGGLECCRGLQSLFTAVLQGCWQGSGSLW